LNGLGIVAALAAESRPLGAGSRGPDGAVTLADGTLLILSGVGLSAAADAARRLAAAGARALVSWGMAGGLDPALAAGTLVLPAEIISPEGSSFTTAPDWRERVSGAIAAQLPVCCGRLLTCREALRSVAAKALAFRETAAVAVDMESSAIAEVAAAERLPFLAVRAIVDGAADEVPTAALNAATVGTGALRIGRLLAALARTPGELPSLIRLAGRYRSARRALSVVARSGAVAPQALRGLPGGALT
jgi:adenosylhomocysteine nucleosidase